MTRETTPTEWLAQFKIGQTCYIINYYTRQIETGEVTSIVNSPSNAGIGIKFEKYTHYYKFKDREDIFKTEKIAINVLRKHIKDKISKSEKYIVEFKKELDVLNKKETN